MKSNMFLGVVALGAVVHGASASVLVEGNYSVSKDVNVILRIFDGETLVDEVVTPVTLDVEAVTRAELSSLPVFGELFPDVLGVEFVSFNASISGETAVEIAPLSATLTDFSYRFGDGFGTSGEVSQFFPSFGGAFFGQKGNFADMGGMLDVAVNDSVILSEDISTFGPSDFDLFSNYRFVTDSSRGGEVLQEIDAMPFVFADFSFGGVGLQFEVVNPEGFFLNVAATAPIEVVPSPSATGLLLAGVVCSMRRRGQR